MRISLGRKVRKKRDHQETLDLCARTIIKWILREIGWGGTDWIDLAHGRDQWRALVNTVMYFRVP
jgi:hypothetical protein